MSSSIHRPPLPLGRASVVKNEGSSSSQQQQVVVVQPAGPKDMDSSENSRSSLRRSFMQRRSTLTVGESAFLERLIETGDEIEVQVAHENLLNEKLFFEAVDDMGSDDDGGEGGFRLAAAASSGRSTSGGTSYTKSMTSLDALIAEDHARFVAEQRNNNNNNNNMVMDSPCGSTDGLGSERRKELLQQRRQSSLYGQIWQAHENGLAVTSKSSRRSMLARTMSSKNMKQQVKTTSHRVDDIFRARRRSSSSSSRRKSSSSSFIIPPFRGSKGTVPEDKPIMDDVKSDNNRRRPVVPVSPTAAAPPLNDEPKKANRPSLRRLASDASRKSVTFELPEVPAPTRFGDRAVSEGAARLAETTVPATLPPRPRPMEERVTSDLSRQSEFSFPSLHMAHSIRSISGKSDATTDSVSEDFDDIRPLRPTSPPSIHHGRPIRSESMSSRQNSITTFDSSTMDWLEGRDPSDVKDEKKEEDGDGIPTKVVIPTTGLPQDIQLSTKLLDEGSSVIQRPVMMRYASKGVDEGEGIEVAEYDADTVKESMSPRKHSDTWEFASIHTSNSFDETMSFGRISGIFRRRPSIQRSMSEEDMRGIFLGGAILKDSVTSRGVVLSGGEDPSYRLEDDNWDYYDSWMAIEDEYVNGYGGGDTLPFQILGTSADDKSAMPHVLSPPLMDSIHAFFPYTKTGENYWLKYSMVRDGASLHSFLRHARGSKCSILAIETTDGEVFGAFVGEPWRKNWNYYGSNQTFLWRMRHTRREKTRSIIDQAHMESEIDVFPATGENRCFQLCTDDNIAVGGGNLDSMRSTESLTSDPQTIVKDHEWGPGLLVREDLLQGTTSPCLTFGSPSLSHAHSDGSLFEIINLELWTLTPCMTQDEAEKLELSRLFLEKHGHHS